MLQKKKKLVTSLSNSYKESKKVMQEANYKPD